ncbi:hypothetical protein BH24ACT3_BH24ACT3_07980 [soil metagenome]
MLLVGSASPASAHASLVGTTPGDGAELDRAPGDVVLEFNEPVSVSLGGVRVFDADGDRVDRDDPATEANTVRVDLQPEIGDSTYVVTYRVASADGHPIRGAFLFRVGEAGEIDESTLAAFFSEGADRPWEITAAVLRFATYLGALLVAGGALFLAVVHDGCAGRRRLSRPLLARPAPVGAGRQRQGAGLGDTDDRRW